MPLRILATMVATLLISGCYTVEVDSVEEWCAQISGENLYDRAPFWALLPGVKINGDAIRAAYVEMLNSAMMEQVEGRAERMAWAAADTLHVENIGNLMQVSHEEVISEWRSGIARAKDYDFIDAADRCFYGGIASLYDTVVIHSAEHDGLQWVREWTTEIDSERQSRLGDPI